MISGRVPVLASAEIPAAAESRTGAVVSAAAVLLILPLVFLLLRIYSKIRHRKRCGWDDALLVLLAFCCILGFVAAGHGLGHHIYNLPPGHATESAKLTIIGEFLGLESIALGQTSVAVTLLQLAITRTQKIILWGIIISVNLTKFFSEIFVLATCSPVQKNWDVTDEITGKCWDMTMVIGYYIFSGAWSAAMDIVLVIIPWVMIWELQMQKVEKIGLGLTFTMGIVSAITSIVKTCYIPTAGQTKDRTYEMVPLITWSLAEAAVIIMAASIPFLRVLTKEVYNMSKRIARHAGIRLATMGSESTLGSLRDNQTTWATRVRPELSRPAPRGGIITTHEVLVSRTDLESGENLVTWEAVVATPQPVARQ
ncbi:hypothetical protein B0H66DRAFT_607308 [Apodospora peruviana]|uniref:Rhodopsin domain-containing protein n=1 Tax=Apodospora peruviana TaxID=516989 RepID=A0AAE0HW81_9PEZI|nr:hypothetical protein B0H66DRAFT_607308 [Apodospora peruviana]